MTRPAEIPGYLGRVLDSSGGGVGTCHVAPGVLVTAWHVVDGLGVGEPGGKVLINQLGTDPSAGGAAPARVRAVDAVRDLAVLVCDRPLDECVVGLVESDSVAAGTGVAVSGVAHVPGEDFRCTSATGSWEGPAMRADQVAMGQVKASGVARGMSGAPVRRAADGRVAGVVSGRYNAGDVWPGPMPRQAVLTWAACRCGVRGSCWRSRSLPGRWRGRWRVLRRAERECAGDIKSWADL
jgi:hypothetical protein